MTIPTRPAPPPPNQKLNSSSAILGKSYPNKKPAPPRPPPPRVTSASVKKSGSQKSISILSNIFGSKNSSKAAPQVPTEAPKQQQQHTATDFRLPPKLPAPPRSFPLTQPKAQQYSDVQLINFDESPTSSPPSIKKSNTGSDSISMDSFCSSTSTPNNFGAMSQAESGFENDFCVSDFKVTSGVTSRSTTFSSDPFDCIDDFGTFPSAPVQASNIRNVKPVIQPKPTFTGSSNFYDSTSSIVPSAVVDTLNNGKSLIKPSTVSMPTIIKPISKGKSSPVTVDETKKTAVAQPFKELKNNDSFEDELPSPPMPTIPPPPPPSFENTDEDDSEMSSYGIALYDFESDVPEDLNLRANDKVYLIKQMNDEWIYGRNKRGCEGIFPISFIDIRVPLQQVDPDSGNASRCMSTSPAVESHRVNALYTFIAETEEDLTIRENEVVNVIYEINSEWLYGFNEQGEYGQFPANFIEFPPQNLPQMPK